MRSACIPDGAAAANIFDVHLCKLGADYHMKIRIAELEDNMILGCLRYLFSRPLRIRNCKQKLGVGEGGLETGAGTAELGEGLEDPGEES